MKSTRCMKRVVLAGVLLVSVMVLAAACGSGSSSTTGTSGAAVTTPPTVANPGTSPTDVTIPPPDSPATPIYQALGLDSIYVRYWLQIESGWAYTHLIPFTSSNGPTLDTRALLRQDADGIWQVLATNESRGLLTDVGAVAEDQAVPDDFKSRFPDAPSSLFPEVRPADKAVMDAVRTALARPDYRFNVFTLNQDQGWAFAEFRGLAYDGEGHTIETIEERALLRETNGAWTVLTIEAMATGSRDAFFAKAKSQFTEAPATVLQ
jgi:hypothetical protein